MPLINIAAENADLAEDKKRKGVFFVKTRIISAVVLLPVLICLVVWGSFPLQVAMGVLGILAMYEYYRVFSPQQYLLHGVGYLFTVIYVIWIHPITERYFPIFTSVFLVVLLILSVIDHEKVKPMDCFTTFFGFFYGCFLLSHVYLVREFAYGKLLVWLIFLAAFGCDTGAYFTGMACGKHKLIPTLSPKKTVEGAVGGVITATVLSIVYGVIIGNYYTIEGVNLLLLCGLTGFIGSFLAQIGDLAASAMKRSTGIKDFGKLIPGHGGVLDRFDSVILTAPAVYYVMYCLIDFHG